MLIRAARVSKRSSIYGTEFLMQNAVRYTSERMRMREPAYLLDAPRRQIILNTVKEVCNYRG